MEFLISSWSIEARTFIVAWGDFGPTLEDVVALICLPMFEEVKALNFLET